MSEVIRKDEPETHDYPAPEAYLSLSTGPDHAKQLADDLASCHLDENTDILCRIAGA